MASSTDLPYILSGLFSGAIEVAQMRDWADRVLESEEHPPAWVIELSLFNSSPMHVYKSIGFVPDTELPPEEETAILFHAYRRGRLSVDDGTHALEQLWCDESEHPNSLLCREIRQVEALRATGRREEAHARLGRLLGKYRSFDSKFLAAVGPERV